MTDPATTRVPTPPGSVVVLRIADDDDTEGMFAIAEELHQQTGLPVVVTTPGAELSATTPREAHDALRRVLALRLGDDSSTTPTLLLDDLRKDGWGLVRLREPE